MSNYTGYHCPVCGKAFVQGDDVVVCPDCGAPHHRECYRRLGHCALEDKHASGAQWQPQEDRREPDPVCWGRATEERILAGICRLAECAAEVTVVTDDVFSGGLSYGGETEEYMKVLGNVNRRLAELAGGVTEVVFGIPVCLKKESVERLKKENAERAVSRGEGEQRCAGSEA